MFHYGCKIKPMMILADADMFKVQYYRKKIVSDIYNKFIAVVNKISVEMIGKNEESIIVIVKQLL